MRAVFKFIAILGMIGMFLVHGFVAKIYFRNIWKLRAHMIPCLTRYCQLAMKIMNFKITKNDFKNRTPFIVSNHLSYLDILVLSSQLPTTYVTSLEMKKVPVLGWITQVAGCLYVDRKSRENLSNEIRDITEALQKGLSVTVFPEATSTNAEQVLPFKRPLFQASKDSSTPISPLCLNYKAIDGKSFSIQNRDFICWYGDMYFVPHLWNVMKLRSVEVELNFLNPLPVDHEKDNSFLASASHSIITSAFVPVSPALHLNS